MGLREGHTVFLVLDGYTFDKVDNEKMSFWHNLAAALKSAGYDVVTKGNSEIIPGCKYVFFPPWETAIFVGLCGYCISIPTGVTIVAGSINDWQHIHIQFLVLDEHDSSWFSNRLAWHAYIMTLVLRKGRQFVDDFIRWAFSEFPLSSSNVICERHVAKKWDKQLIDKLIDHIKDDEKLQREL